MFWYVWVHFFVHTIFFHLFSERMWILLEELSSHVISEAYFKELA